MLHDIAPHVYHNEFRAIEPAPGDLLLFYSDAGVLMQGSDDNGADKAAAPASAAPACADESARDIRESGIFPTFRESGVAPEDCMFLFEIDGVPFFLGPASIAIRPQPEGPLPDDPGDPLAPPTLPDELAEFSWHTVRRRGVAANWAAFAAAVGQQLF